MPEDASIPPPAAPGADPKPAPESPSELLPAPGLDLGPGPGINIGEEFGTAKRNFPPAKIVGIVLAVGLSVSTRRPLDSRSSVRASAWLWTPWWKVAANRRNA